MSPWKREGWVQLSGVSSLAPHFSWMPKVHLRMVELEETLRYKSLPSLHYRKPSLVILTPAVVTGAHICADADHSYQKIPKLLHRCLLEDSLQSSSLCREREALRRAPERNLT